MTLRSGMRMGVVIVVALLLNAGLLVTAALRRHADRQYVESAVGL